MLAVTWEAWLLLRWHTKCEWKIGLMFKVKKHYSKATLPLILLEMLHPTLTTLVLLCKLPSEAVLGVLSPVFSCAVMTESMSWMHKSVDHDDHHLNAIMVIMSSGKSQKPSGAKPRGQARWGRTMLPLHTCLSGSMHCVSDHTLRRQSWKRTFRTSSESDQCELGPEVRSCNPSTWQAKDRITTRLKPAWVT